MSSRTHNRFPNLVIQQRDWEHPGNLTLEGRGIWLQNFHRTEETDSWRSETKPCVYQDPGERISVPTRDWASLAFECPGVSSGGVGQQCLLWGQFSSVAQSCLTLCDSMNHSTSGLPAHHQLLDSTQTHVYCIGDAIQTSNPLSSPSPPALNPYRHQGLFKWISFSHQVAEVLQFQLQHQSYQRTLRADLL